MQRMPSWDYGGRSLWWEIYAVGDKSPDLSHPYSTPLLRICLCASSRPHDSACLGIRWLCVCQGSTRRAPHVSRYCLTFGPAAEWLAASAHEPLPIYFVTQITSNL